MHLVSKTTIAFTFATNNGATWTRQKLQWANKSVAIRGWNSSRDLFLPDEYDKAVFPDATHRIEITNGRDQESPHFNTLPCRIKPGTKNILQIFNDDGDDYITEVRISKHFNW